MSAVRIFFMAVLFSFTGPLPCRFAEAGPKTYIVKPGGVVWTSSGRQYRRGRQRRRIKVKLVRLEGGSGFVIANPKISYGTRLVVYNLNKIMTQYRKRFPDAPPVIIRDLSKRGGGPLPNHASHLDGRDVDIPLILNKMTDITSQKTRTINAERTWFLVKALADTCDVDFIFLDRQVQKLLHGHAVKQGVATDILGPILQYPATKGAGLVQHWPKHIDHLHVRFRQEGVPLGPLGQQYCKRGSSK